MSPEPNPTHEVRCTENAETHNENQVGQQSPKISSKNQQDETTEEEKACPCEENDEEHDIPVAAEEQEEGDNRLSEATAYIASTQSSFQTEECLVPEVETKPLLKEQHSSPHKPNLFKPIPIEHTASVQSNITESLESIVLDVHEDETVEIVKFESLKEKSVSLEKIKSFEEVDTKNADSSPHKPNLFKPIPIEHTSSIQSNITESPTPNVTDIQQTIPENNTDSAKLEALKEKLASLEKIKSFSALEEKSAVKMEIMKLESSLMRSSGDIYKPAFASYESKGELGLGTTRSAPSTRMGVESEVEEEFVGLEEPGFVDFDDEEEVELDTEYL
jgi:hypothetical protein